MNKSIITLSVILGFSLFAGTPAFAATEAPHIINTSRLSGQTRFETAKVIAEYYSSGAVKNVILSTGNQFADALSASVLAHQMEAPILLVDASVDSSKAAFDYVIQHLDPTGTVYIIGGDGVIGKEFETKLTELGFINIVRIAGMNRYETASKVANTLNDTLVSTVVISSGEQYPDALSISGFAANKGWPILLSPRDALQEDIKNYILEKKPSKVFITGGEGVISEQVVSEIRGLLPQASTERLMGQSRFDTNALIAETFALSPSTLYIATGYGFADALAGSAVAARNGDPIIFIDPSEPTLPKSVARYLEKLNANKLSPNLVSFGGSGVVTDEIIKSSSDLISGAVEESSIYSIAEVMASVTQREDYSFPTFVQAKLYNSDAIEVPVKWNPTTVDTSSVGASVYEGVVAGYVKPIKLKLTVKEPGPIAQYTTYFDASIINRTENIRLAAKALDGKLLAPGEQFSFNKTVGQRTAEAGYKEAMFIVGKTYVPGLGGGVCQVSSTLYNVAVLAHLEILERHHHSLPVNYVPPGQDATVSFPYSDFRFRNITDNYLLIRSFVEGNSLTSLIYRK